MASQTRRPTPPRSNSTHQSRGSENEPRLPHERDESTDSQSRDDAANPQAREMGEKALEDLRAGRVDTDRGPVMDRLYRRNLRRGGKDRRPR